METINTILFWAFLYVFLWNAYILLFNRGVPNIKTAPAIRKKIIEIIREDLSAKNIQPYTIIDLGCGNGDFARQMARALPESQVIGIEISKLAHWRARLLQKFRHLKNLSFKNNDFLKEDLSSANAVTIFQLDTYMPQIRQKLKQDIRPGTLITANKFPLGGEYTPLETIDVKTRYPHQKTLHIYRT